MFNSGFSETTLPASSSSRSHPSTFSELDDEGELSLDEGSDTTSTDDEENPGWDEDDDSPVDESEEEDEDEPDEEHFQDLSPLPSTSSNLRTSTATITAHAPVSPELSRSSRLSTTPPTLTPRSRTSSASLTNDVTHSISTAPSNPVDSPESGQVTPPHANRFVDAPSAPSSPAKASATMSSAGATAVTPHGVGSGRGKEKRRESKQARGDGRARFEVVITDATYSTYRSLLHFLYTDSITFSPLASTYYVAKDASVALSVPFPYASRRAYILAHSPPLDPAQGVGACSSKAIYRLADKMQLDDLKERAYEHIVSSLTSANVRYPSFLAS